MYPQELDNASRRPERSVVSGGDDALCDAKVLQAAPSLADNEFGFWPPKRIAAVALQIRLVVFRFCDPFEDLVRQDVLAELGDFDLNTADDIFWDEYYLQSAVEHIIGTLFLTSQCSLKAGIIKKLVRQDREFLEEARIGARRLHVEGLRLFEILHVTLQSNVSNRNSSSKALENYLISVRFMLEG